MNGDFSILNGGFSIQIFQKRFQLFFWKFSVNCFPETFLHSEWRNLQSPFRMEKSPFTFFEKRFHHFFCKIWNCKWKTLLKKKWYFSILNGDFFIHFFSEAFWTFFWKKKRYRNFSPFKIEKSPYWMEISPCFSEVFLIFFWKKNIYREFSPFRMEKYPFWMKISPFIFFRSVLIFYWKTNSTNFSIQNWTILSILNWDFSIHFFFSEVVWTLKKKPTDNVLHSIFFRSVLNFFFEKQIPQIIFSIQNGEISILNGDFSIHFFFRRVLNFKKKYLQIIFSIQNGEWRFLHSNAFQKRFWFFFENNLYREFSPFRMEKSPFWMKTSPFIFSEAFWFFIEKQTPQIIFSIQNWKNLHSEWRFLHSIFFRSVFI